MKQPPKNLSSLSQEDSITEEYRILHQVAQILQTSSDLTTMLTHALKAITGFQELKVENKAGIFLVNEDHKSLRLFITYGNFSKEFLEAEKEIPFGDCLCGRVAVSGELLMSQSCFTDKRHDRIYPDMKAHGHYIIPLNADQKRVGVMFLYTNTDPVWYRNSQDVLLSIGGLIANAIQKKQNDTELAEYRSQLENLVESRTVELSETNKRLINEIEKHQKTQEGLRRLSNQTEKVREEEKSQISRKVHDELGQLLTAIKMDILQLEKKLSNETPSLSGKTAPIVELVDNTIQSVQQIAVELRPPVLDAFGLREALSWQAGEYQKRFGIKFVLTFTQGELDIDKEVKLALFRIFQEVITNVVRHSEATQVNVDLSQRDNELVLVIHDNGKGITQEQLDSFSSIGIIGIRERARNLNGEAVFQGAPGNGTTVEILLPFPKP